MMLKMGTGARLVFHLVVWIATSAWVILLLLGHDPGAIGRVSIAAFLVGYVFMDLGTEMKRWAMADDKAIDG